MVGQNVSCFLVFSLLTLRDIRAVVKQKEINKWGVFQTERLMDQKQIIGSEFSIYLRLLTVYLFYVYSSLSTQKVSKNSGYFYGIKTL